MIWNQRTFYELLRVLVRGQRWLEIGCGRLVKSPELARVREKFGEAFYVGMDIDRPSLIGRRDRVVEADAVALPFPDSYFGVVSADMVFEHLSDPAQVLRECWRVLGEDGVVIIHTSCASHYLLTMGRGLSHFMSNNAYRRAVAKFTGRREEDIFPTWYRVNTRARLAKAIESAGFKAGMVALTETPNRPAWLMRWLPHSIKSSLLAVYFKCPPPPPLVRQIHESRAEHSPADRQ